MSIVTGESFVGTVRTGAGSFSGTTGFKYAMAVDVEVSDHCLSGVTTAITRLRRVTL
jgi:hypothetical protein